MRPFAVIFLAMMALRMALSLRFGVNIPWWDEWDEPLMGTFRPWLSGSLTWDMLLAPHNEHRIVPTRLLEIGLLELSGRQWNHLPEIVIGQALYCLAGVILIRALAGLLDGAVRQGFIVLAALVLSLPFGWESMIWGFESQIYICMALSLGGMVLTTAHPPRSRAFAAGIAMLLTAIISFAAGELACIAAALVLGLRHGLADRSRTGLVAAALLLGAVVLAATTTGGAGTTAPMADHSLAGEAWTFAQNVSWPSEWLPFAGLAPTVWYLAVRLWRQVRQMEAMTGADWFLAVVSAWVVGFAAVVTHARGEIASRYMDILILMTPVNIATFIVLVTPLVGRSAIKGGLLAFGWGAVQAIGVVGATGWSLRQAQVIHDRLTGDLAVLRTYLATGQNRAAILNGSAPIPYPDPRRFLERVDYACSAGILPPLTDGQFLAGQQGVATALLALGCVLFVVMATGAARAALAPRG